MAQVRTETRFGATSSLGTTYTSLFSVAASTTANVLLNVTNRTSSTVTLRAYVAESSWTTGEPSGGDLVAAIAYDMPIAAGDVVQISGIVMDATEELIVRSSVASSLDIIGSGMALTNV